MTFYVDLINGGLSVCGSPSEHCTLPYIVHTIEFILTHWPLENVAVIIPPATKLGGVYWIHPVCLSVRLSVCLSVGALIFSLICAWINGWVNNSEAGDLRRHHAHYDVIVMSGDALLGSNSGSTSVGTMLRHSAYHIVKRDFFKVWLVVKYFKCFFNDHMTFLKMANEI